MSASRADRRTAIGTHAGEQRLRYRDPTSSAEPFNTVRVLTGTGFASACTTKHPRSALRLPSPVKHATGRSGRTSFSAIAPGSP